MPKPKKVAPAAKPPKYEPVVVTPVPCPLEELEAHLRAFISSSIAAEARDRWLDCLIEKRPLWFAQDKPPKNIKVLHKLDGLLSRFHFYAQSVSPIKGADTFPLSLAGVFADARGVYFDLQTAPCTMTAAEAATTATENFSDALLSLDAGKLALFFSHEGDLWLCKG